MVSRQHTHRSAFFWDSKLSGERKDEIIAWVKSLNDKDAKKLDDLLTDHYEDAHWNGEQDGDGYGQ